MSKSISIGLLAVGFALGVGAASLSNVRATANPSPEGPRINNVRGTLDGELTRNMRPVTVRVRDKVEQTGEPTNGDLVLTHMDVNGTPVLVTFAVEDQ